MGESATDDDDGGELETALTALGHFRLYQQYVLLLLGLLAVCFGLLYHTHSLELQSTSHRCWERECAAWLTDAELEEGLACAQLQYLHNDTLYAQLNLACRERLRGALEVLQSCLQFVCLLLSGYIADRYGRRASLIWSGVLAAAAALATACGVSAVGLLLPALSRAGLHTAIVTAVEAAVPSLRAVFSCIPRAMFSLGGVLAGVGGVLRHPAAALAPVLALPAAALLLPEGPRWLHAAGRSEKAVKMIKKAARWNKLAADPDTMSRLGAERPPRGSGRRSWLSARRRVSLALAAAAGGALAGRGGGAADLTATVLAMMALQRWGRRGTLTAALCVAGAARAGAAKFGGRGLPALARGAAELAACGVALLAAEVLPGRARALGVAACGAAAVLADLAVTRSVLAELSPGWATLWWLSVAAAGSAAAAATPHHPRAPLPQHRPLPRHPRAAAAAPPTPPPHYITHL